MFLVATPVVALLKCCLRLDRSERNMSENCPMLAIATMGGIGGRMAEMTLLTRGGVNGSTDHGRHASCARRLLVKLRGEGGHGVVDA